MNFIRKVANSDLLSNIIDIPKELKNRKVEIIILPYDSPINSDISDIPKNKTVKGALSNYKNEKLQEKENGAWASAVMGKYENS